MAKKSTLSDLEAKLAERAETNVQAKLKVFQADIEAALSKLFGPRPAGQRGNDKFGSFYYEDSPPDAWDFARAKRKALELAIQDSDYNRQAGTYTKRGWPKLLWSIEAERLRDELLAKMDLMQQLINAPERDTSNDVPHESEA